MSSAAKTCIVGNLSSLCIVTKKNRFCEGTNSDVADGNGGGSAKKTPGSQNEGAVAQKADCALPQAVSLRLRSFPASRVDGLALPQNAPSFSSAAQALTALNGHLARQNGQLNYDRLTTVVNFCRACSEQSTQLGPKVDFAAAEKNFKANSLAWMQSDRGGNCVGLSLDLLRRVKKDGFSRACIIGSTLVRPYAFRGPDAPDIAHAAVLVGFYADGQKDLQEYLLEPGFNFTEAIRVPGADGSIERIRYDDYVWHLSRKLPLEGDTTGSQGKLVCDWVSEKSKTKRSAYDLSPIADPDDVITRRLPCVDRRPVVLARDEKGNVTAKLIVDFKKQCFKVTVQGGCEAVIDFDKITRGEPFATLYEHSELLAKMLKWTPEKLENQVREAAAAHQNLKDYEAYREVARKAI